MVVFRYIGRFKNINDPYRATSLFILQVKFLKDESNFGKYLIKRTDGFVQSDDSLIVQVQLMWGMKHQDISECHHTDVECTGKNVWDEQFNVDSIDIQRALWVRSNPTKVNAQNCIY